MFTIKAFRKIGSLDHWGYEAEWYSVANDGTEIHFASVANSNHGGPSMVSLEHYERVVVENARGQTVANITKRSNQ